MTHPILVTGAAGGPQGSTGRQVASLLMEQGIPVRAFVHKRDSRSDELRKQGAEVVEGDLLNPASASSIRGHHGRAVGQCSEGAAQSSCAGPPDTPLAILPQR